MFQYFVSAFFLCWNKIFFKENWNFAHLRHCIHQAPTLCIPDILLPSPLTLSRQDILPFNITPKSTLALTSCWYLTPPCLHEWHTFPPSHVQYLGHTLTFQKPPTPHYTFWLFGLSLYTLVRHLYILSLWGFQFCNKQEFTLQKHVCFLNIYSTEFWLPKSLLDYQNECRYQKLCTTHLQRQFLLVNFRQFYI